MDEITPTQTPVTPEKKSKKGWLVGLIIVIVIVIVLVAVL